jgi:AbrB family looped-hinge helix DNA binding protein
MKHIVKRKPETIKKSVRLRAKNQITIPADLIEALHLEEGEQLEIQIENGHLVLVPVVTIEKDQSWFWTEQWQQEEREVEAQLTNQELSKPMDLDETLAELDQLSKET